jgi:pimeloyl-ACP methyl ester carboxylesterase
MIDIIGMGASSRPVFNLDDPNKIDEYLVEWLELWRTKMCLEDFVLAGHSFGGYVSGLYATKYHYHLRKLLLISPLGISKMPDDFDL